MSLPHPDQRISALVDWLTTGLRLDIHQFAPASSDASFRRYFRVRHRQGVHIVMDAPPDKENISAFIDVARLLKTAGMHTPEIYENNLQLGFLLLEDFGSEDLLRRVNQDNAEQFYCEALNELLGMQAAVDIHHCGLPDYGAALLERELDIFDDWFLEKLLGVILPVAIKYQLQPLLIDSALAQPQVCVHRDYHSRNLMVLDDNHLGVLDFQDALIGPICYDAVSLLRDCYIRWPETRVEHWLRHFYERLSGAHRLDADYSQFKRWFDLMGLQRHLKAIGIFARLYLRDGKPGYLNDIPRTLSYVSQVTEHYPELAEFDHFLKRQILPVYQAAL